MPLYIGVLDPNDQSHQFIKQRETLRPLAMFKHPNGSILLCYNGIVNFFANIKTKRDFQRSPFALIEKVEE